MGKAFFDADPEIRSLFREAEEACGLPLIHLCFEGPEEKLRETEITQPAILLASLAAWKCLEAGRGVPEWVAGHSLGEYTALVAAGSLSIDDALRTVRQRGRFMQEAVPAGQGAMSAVLGMELPDLEEVCRNSAEGEVVTPANLNAPGQIVISGHAGAVERAGRLARERGAYRVIPLQVSAPFHCELMTPAADRLAPLLGDLDFRDLAIPLVNNWQGVPIRTGSEVPDSLIRQVTAPVRWEESMRRMIREGVTDFIEVGPKKVLTKLARKIDPRVRVHNVEDPDSLMKTQKALSSGSGTA